jgi:hypothetical protein
MKRPDGNIVVLTFEASLSCFVTYINCKDLVSTRPVASVSNPGAGFFFAAHNQETYRIMALPSLQCSDTHRSHLLRLNSRGLVT